MGKRKRSREEEGRESSPSEPEDGGRASSPKRMKTEASPEGKYL